jgi:predicted aspartyl protease
MEVTVQRVSAVMGVVLALSAAPAAARAGDRSSVTSFTLTGRGGIIVQVEVNGRGIYPFLLDTGSSHSSISERLALEVGAPLVARAMVGSVVGGTMRPVARLDRLVVGPAVARAVLPSVLAPDAMTSLEDVDGVLGQDVLASCRYTIDFGRRLVIWLSDADSTSASGSSFVLEPSHGRFIARFPQDRSVLRLVPDSGADSLLLFRQPDRRLPPMSLASDRPELATLSARARVRQGTVHELRIGETMLRDVPAVVVERDSASPAESDGLLPLHLFERVTVDGPGRRLTVYGSALAVRR